MSRSRFRLGSGYLPRGGHLRRLRSAGNCELVTAFAVDAKTNFEPIFRRFSDGFILGSVHETYYSNRCLIF